MRQPSPLTALVSVVVEPYTVKPTSQLPRSAMLCVILLFSV
jgi:hypothetical protein